MQSIEFKLVKLFNNCPKPSGWFAARARLDDGSYATVKGVTYLRLVTGVRFAATVRSRDLGQYGEEYEIKDLKLVDGMRNVEDYLGGVLGRYKEAQDVIDDMVGKFGSNLLQVIETQPASLRRFFASCEDLWEEFMDAFVVASVGSVLSDSMKYITREVILSVVKKYGLEAYAKVTKEPYRLLDDFGCGEFRFSEVDHLALSLGFDPLCDARVAACCKHSVKTVLDKDICMDVTVDRNFGKLAAQLRKDLTGNGCVGRIAAADLEDARLAGYLRRSEGVALAVEDTKLGEPGHTFVYEKHAYDREVATAKILKTMVGRPTNLQFCAMFRGLGVNPTGQLVRQFEQSYGRLDPAQRKAVFDCTGNSVSVLTGGPGTGKTTTIRAIVYLWESVMNNSVYLLAPTWLALKKMRQAVSSLGLGRMVYASTVQSFVKSQEGALDSSRLVIVDETSMVGFMDGCRILELCKDANVIFVGDGDQLPSIKPGDFFHDVMSVSGMTVSRLSTCHRMNAAILKENADKVNAGFANGKLRLQPGVFEFQAFNDETGDMAQYIASRYMEYMAQRGLEPPDIAVLCAMHKGEAGTDRLNALIRDQVVKLAPTVKDPSSIPTEEIYAARGIELKDVRSGHSGATFRVGDRVISLENRHEDGYTNGDMGEIVSFHLVTVPGKLDKSYVVVRLDGKDSMVEVQVDRFRHDFDLAYAVTVHKSQGCEWPVVMFSSQPGLPHTPPGFATSSLLYTGMTRGRDTVEIVGSVEAVNHCAVTKRPLRQSLLAERTNALVADDAELLF